MTDTIDSTAIVLHDSLAPVLSTAAAVAGLRALQDFVGSYLKEGNDGYGDYGIIPGTKRPTLFKSGAEKLCDVYGFTPSYEVTERILDWAGGLIFYEIHARLVRRGAGDVIGEGWGSCNSRESKFATTEYWDERGDPPADAGWKKGSKNGRTWWSRKAPHANPADLANNVLKTAKKRALVDAVLGATRSSGLFTQDMEDVPPASGPADYEPPAQPQPARRAAPTPVPNVAPVNKDERDWEGQDRFTAPAEDAPAPRVVEPERAALMARLKAARIALGMSTNEMGATLTTHLGAQWQRTDLDTLTILIENFERQAADVQAPA